MADRLEELVRQRALVQEHLAWLNREIARAAESARMGVPPSGPADPAKPGAEQPCVPPGALTPVAADDILARYQVSPATVKRDVRLGCALYFAAALVLVATLVAGLYFLLQKSP